MSFFDPQPPTLRELIAYSVRRSRERGATLNRTKLVKLLYLLDVDLVGSGRQPATGIEWVFFHYGPWSQQLAEELSEMESRDELITRPFNGAILYDGARDDPSAERWPTSISSKANRIIDRWAGEELGPLLDFVYFDTEPMRQATRGDVLDLSLERTARREREHYRALEAPQPPPDLQQRLERWRASRRQRLAEVPADAPTARLNLPEEPDFGVGVRGRLSVLSDDEL